MTSYYQNLVCKVLTPSVNTLAIQGVDTGYPAYSHHDRFPPWWVFVRDDYGGNLSGDKFPP